MLNSEFIKDKFFDKYIYKVEFARMLPVFLQKYYLLFRPKIVFCKNVTYSQRHT